MIPDPPDDAPHPAVAIALAFHQTYEQLAPRFGYKTRENRDLMVATVAALLKLDVIRQGENQP